MRFWIELPAPHKHSMVVYFHISSNYKVEAGGSKVQGHLRLSREFKVTLPPHLP